jgi:hypothetical protein
MARFYASIRGNRGEATRQGSEKSGIEGHIRGWTIGASVNCYVDGMGEDVVRITITGGSRDPSSKKYVGRFKIFNGQLTEVGGGETK